jgi:hypothetical protein
MKKIFFRFYLFLGLGGCISKLDRTPLVEKIVYEQDSLLNEAKWELYKWNVSTQNDFKKQQYLFCNDTLIPFVNYGFDIYTKRVVYDTIIYSFAIQWFHCATLSPNGLHYGSQCIRGDGSSWTPYVGVKYVSNRQTEIYMGSVKIGAASKDDKPLANYLTNHRDSINNVWLLSYYDKVIKPRLYH